MALERLDKLLASTGHWSRREVKDLVRQGRVLADGRPAARPEDKFDPERVRLSVDGREVDCAPFVYLMLHKPAGLLSATEELLIPEEMDESYDDYLALQASQGFDLEQYAGKRVKRYTYEITNYPTGEAGIQAGLLIYKNTVIGGDVLSPQLGGFIHGLEMPE